MKTYELKLMIHKEGGRTARLGFVDVEADSEQEALATATAEGRKIYENSCATLGHRPDEKVRIWAELSEEE